MASLILRRVSADTLDGLLRARETVTWETPAMRPTVAIVTPRDGCRVAFRFFGLVSPSLIRDIFPTPRFVDKRYVQSPCERALRDNTIDPAIDAMMRTQSTTAIQLLVKKIVRVPKDSRLLTK